MALIHAAGVGIVTTLLARPGEERDPQLPRLARDAVLASIVSDASVWDDTSPASLAVGLRARLGATKVLTPGERLLLDELLNRLSEPIGH